MENLGAPRGAIRGAVVGLAAALFGTLGIAVASYSGNVSSASGNEASQPVHAEHAEGAHHSWYYSLEDGGSIRYTFGAWRADSVTGSSDATIHEKGGVSARIDACSDRSDASTCTQRVWKGGLVLSRNTGYQALYIEKLFLLSASFYGDLFDVETGEGCRFNVRFLADRENALEDPTDAPGLAWWAATVPQGSPEVDDERSVVGPVGVPRTGAFERAANATVTSECWPAMAADSTDGTIWRNVRQLGL
jgi:hypothetical protein